MLHKITIDQHAMPFTNPFQIIAIRPLLRLTHQSSSYRIQMIIPTEVHCLLIIADLDAFGTTFEQSAVTPLMFVKGLCVTAE